MAKKASTGKKAWLRKNKIAAGIVGAFAFLFIVDFAWNGPAFLRRLDTLFHAYPGFWWIMLAFFVVGYGIFGVRAYKKVGPRPAEDTSTTGDSSSYRRKYEHADYFSKLASASIPAHVIAALGIVVASIYMFAVHNYLTDHEYSLRAKTSDSAVTSFNDRAPWVVANSYASRDQGDNVGNRGDVNHVPVPGGESSRYTTLITGRGWAGLAGYDSVREFNLPKVGIIPQSAGTSCKTPEAMQKRWNVMWPTRSLARELAFKAPLAHWSDEDLYGYCRDGKPVVVMPLWKYEGMWVATKVAAGAAIYDESGFRVLSPAELVKEGIEGPTYPSSLVSTEREALVAMGSLGDWYANRSGYELTDKDHEDANAANNNGFSLVGTDNKLYYVTPLTPRGSAQNIVALMVAPAQQSADGSGNYVIETSADLVATSTIENNIKSASVSGDGEWVARWASGMRVYEMIPNKNGNWVASIGLGQVVNYRAIISPDGTVSITRTDGGAPSTKPEDTVTVEGGKPLSSMTKEELANLIKKATDELASRK